MREEVGKSEDGRERRGWMKSEEGGGLVEGGYRCPCGRCCILSTHQLTICQRWAAFE